MQLIKDLFNIMRMALCNHLWKVHAFRSFDISELSNRQRGSVFILEHGEKIIGNKLVKIIAYEYAFCGYLRIPK